MTLLDVFKFLAGLASLLGLAVSVWTLRVVRKMERRHIQVVRLPLLLEQLQASYTQAASLLDRSATDAGEAIYRTLRVAESLLLQAAEKMEPTGRVALQNHIRSIQNLLAENPTRNDLFMARVELERAISVLDDYVLTLPLSSP